MATCLLLTVPHTYAPDYSDPGEAADLINDRLDLQMTDAGRPSVFYSDGGGVALEGQSRNKHTRPIDLDEKAYLFFAKNKDTLKRALRTNVVSVSTTTATICIIRNNFFHHRAVTSRFSDPFVALGRKAYVNWDKLKKAGGVFREKTVTTYDYDYDRYITKEEDPIDYVDWLTLYKAGSRVTRLRSGYFIMVARQKDLAGRYDLSSTRALTIPRGVTDTAFISSMLSHD